MLRMFFPIIFSFFCISNLSANGGDDQLRKKADEIAKEILIIDTHIDLPLLLLQKDFDVTVESNNGEFDLPRANKGGLNAASMSIYTSSRTENNGSFKRADTLIYLVQQLESKYPDKFTIAVSAEEVEQNFKKGIFSLPMGLENGSPLEGSLDKLHYFFNKGVRYITLCHVKDNHVCDSSGDTTNTWNGLSPFGESVVREMNKLGIMVDVAHVSDSSFYDVLRLSKVPVIVSHSGCRSLTPGFMRCMSDEMLKALAKNGGVVNIFFGSTLLNNNVRNEYEEWQKRRQEYLKIKDHGETQFAVENPINLGSIQDVIKHIDHAVKVAGIDHVGIGSDFDGVDLLAAEIKDVSMYPNIIYELLKLGYSEKDIRKIMGENFLRVWKTIDKNKG
ncbi:MAG: dipeptidase [Ignavibacteriaceae bacterium]|nr:dipeptidase [Ignavibacteriaceae bacterium]